MDDPKSLVEATAKGRELARQAMGKPTTEIERLQARITDQDETIATLTLLKQAAENRVAELERETAAKALSTRSAIGILRDVWRKSAERSESFATDNPETHEQWRALGDAEALRACADELDPEKDSAFEPCDLEIANNRVAELEKERADFLEMVNELDAVYGVLGTADQEGGEPAAHTVDCLLTELDALQSQVRTLRKALEWYNENARLCRLIHSEGDNGRNALSNDGGYRARAALEATASLAVGAPSFPKCKKDPVDVREFVKYLGPDWKSRAEAAERERDSLRKALDDRWEADCKAAKAIMAAEGRTTGFPSVKDVVGFYMEQAEKLAEALGPFASKASIISQMADDDAEIFLARPAVRKFCPQYPACECDDSKMVTYGNFRRARAALSDFTRAKGGES